MFLQQCSSSQCCNSALRDTQGTWRCSQNRVPVSPAPCSQEFDKQQARYVVANGILDSYRRDKGLPLPPADGGGTSLLQRAAGLLGQQQQQGSRHRRHPTSADPCDDADDTPCFVECVHKVRTLAELQQQLDAAGPEALVVVDFYKTACGACRYVAPGFLKLCKATASTSLDGAAAPPVVFLKHNVYDDEEEEVTELAKKYNVRSVPRFIFFKAGAPIDNFATREKDKVAAAILKHAPPGVELGDWDV